MVRRYTEKLVLLQSTRSEVERNVISALLGGESNRDSELWARNVKMFSLTIEGSFFLLLFLRILKDGIWLIGAPSYKVEADDSEKVRAGIQEHDRQLTPGPFGI